MVHNCIAAFYFWVAIFNIVPYYHPAKAADQTDTPSAGPCVNNTLWSSYDLRTGFEDQRHHFVTATLNNVQFKEMTELSFCFNIYKEINNMEPVIIVDSEQNPVIILGYRETNTGSAEMYIKVRNDTFDPEEKSYLKKGTFPICVTWNGESGDLMFYVYENEELSAMGSNGIGSDFKIPANSQLKIHQEQYAPLKEEKPLEGFVYTVADFYMWDRELAVDDVQKFLKCSGSAMPFLVAPAFAEWDVDDKLM